jgi:hypothetical protein
MCLVLGLTGVALAPDPARAASREDRDQARRLLAEGKKRMRQKRYQDAVRLFEQAHELWQRREIQFNLALAHLELGDKVVAGRHLRRYLAKATPAERQALPERFRRLQRQVGLLRVQTENERVEIWIDGKRRGSGRVEAVVLPGKRSVELRRGSHVLARRVFEVGGGREVVWDPPPLPPPRRSRPPPPRRAVPEDTPGRKPLHWAVFATAAAVAVAAGVAATSTGVRTLQIRDELRTQEGSEYDAGVIEMERHKLATNVLIGITGAAAITAAILAIFTRWRETPRSPVSATLRPTLGPGCAGVGLRLRY